MALKSAEVLSSIPKYKKAMVSLMEKISVLDKLHSGLSYSDVGSEFEVNELKVLNTMSLNRNSHKTRLCIDLLMETLCPEAHNIFTYIFRLTVILYFP